MDQLVEYVIQGCGVVVVRVLVQNNVFEPRDASFVGVQGAVRVGQEIPPTLWA